MLLECEKSNIFLRKCLGAKAVDYYIPMNGSLRWNQRLDDTNINRLATELDDFFHNESYTSPLGLNRLDVELLNWCYENC